MPEEIDLLKTSFFHFEWDGDEVDGVTDVTLPSQEYHPVETDTGTKSPVEEAQGRLEFSDFEVTLDLRADNSESNDKLWEAFEEARTTRQTSAIKKEATVRIKAVDDETLYSVKCTGCWIKEYRPRRLCSMDDLSAQETFVISTDYVDTE